MPSTRRASTRTSRRARPFAVPAVFRSSSQSPSGIRSLRSPHEPHRSARRCRRRRLAATAFALPSASAAGTPASGSARPDRMPASPYIGSHMVHHLLEKGEDVIVLDNLSTGVKENLPTDSEFIEGDAGDEALLSSLFGSRAFDAVIHFAGSVVVPESVARPLEYYRNNTAVSRALVSACIRHQIPNFVFSSTAAVYGSPAVMPVSETAQTDPVSPYGRSKLMTEWILEDARQGPRIALWYCATSMSPALIPKAAPVSPLRERPI